MHPVPREKMVGKMVVSEERKREVEKEIAELENKLGHVLAGKLVVTAQDRIRLEEKLDIARRHLRALNEY
jgi:hypothetical protein